MTAGRRAAIVVGLGIMLLAVAALRTRFELPGRSAYERARLGTPEAELLADFEDLRNVSAPEPGVHEFVAKEGVLTFNGAAGERREDGAGEYRSREDGRVVGWWRQWDTPRHRLTVMFGPDGRVIGHKLEADREPGLLTRLWLLVSEAI